MTDRRLGKRFYGDLEWIQSRPRPFEVMTVRELWTEEYTSARMLEFHLDENNDHASRNKAFIDQSVDWLVNQLGIGQGVRVIDFGCGPGLYTSRLARCGAEVTGVDFSPRSIEYARKQAVANGWNIQYLVKDYLEFTPDRQFDIILLIYCDFCALGPDQRQLLLRKFQSLLKPGGKVVMDVHSLVAFERSEEAHCYAKNMMDGFWMPKPYHGFQGFFKYEAEKVTLEKYTIVGPEKTKIIYNWLQYFSVESLGKELQQAGLAICDVFADVAGRPYSPQSEEFAVVAKRKQD